METINLSKKQFVIYMAVAFGLAWILEMIASVFSNNGNQIVFTDYHVYAVPWCTGSQNPAKRYGMGTTFKRETSLCILCPLDAGVIKYPWRGLVFCDFPGYI